MLCGSHLSTLLRLSSVDLNFAYLIFVYFWVTIPGFLSLNKIFNQRISFARNDTLLYIQMLWFMWSKLLENHALHERPSGPQAYISQKRPPQRQAVKRLSMRERLRGDRRSHRSIRKGFEDGCILLWVRSEIFSLLQWSLSPIIGTKKRNLWHEL